MHGAVSLTGISGLGNMQPENPGDWNREVRNQGCSPAVSQGAVWTCRAWAIPQLSAPPSFLCLPVTSHCMWLNMGREQERLPERGKLAFCLGTPGSTGRFSFQNQWSGLGTGSLPAPGWQSPMCTLRALGTLHIKFFHLPAQKFYY